MTQQRAASGRGQPTQPSRAIALREETEQLLAQPIEGLEELSNRFRALEAQANIVSPVSRVDYVLPMHKISLRTAVVNTNEDAQEVYVDKRFCKHGEVALTKNGMLKLMGAAGVEIVKPTGRIDDRSDPYFCEFEVTLSMRMYDGTTRRITASKVNDFRDGSPETLKPEWLQEGGRNVKTGNLVALDASALADKRRHIVSLTETKAMLRALRTLLNLKQKYKVAELQKPFIVPVLVPDLDANDPETKRALLATALGAQDALFGKSGPKYDGTIKALKAAAGVEDEPANDPRTLFSTDEDDRALAEERAQEIEQRRPEPEPAKTAEPVNEDDFPEIEVPEPEVFVCECPCGDQTEISAEVARITKQRCGGQRCAACYPGRHFDFESHSELPDLGLNPPCTPQQAQQIAERARAKR